MRKELPIAICAICAIIMVLAVFLDIPAISGLKQQLVDWCKLVFAVAYAVGLVNLAQIHLRKINQQREGWPFSVLLLAFMAGMFLVGLFTTGKGPITNWLFQYLSVHPRATMYSILVFFISSAAYRAFRIKSFEATVLLIAAVIVMLGRAPIGEAMWSQIPVMSDWILNNPNTAGMRGITLAAALGGIATALRIVLGIERGHLGGLGD